MAFLARALIFVFVLATSGVFPALAWAQPTDPCLAGVELEEHEDGEDCRTACQCPCCPVRVSFEPLATALPAAPPSHGDFVAPPPAPLRAGVKSEIFHPPSC